MTVRARDLRVNIASMGFERGTVHTLELALEELNIQKQHMRDAAELISQMADQLEQYLQMTTGLTASVAELRRVHNQGDKDEQT